MASNPTMTYFLCCTPRSGSTFDAHVFQQAENLGQVDVSPDGGRLSGTVTPQGEGPSPITLVRRPEA